MFVLLLLLTSGVVVTLILANDSPVQKRDTSIKDVLETAKLDPAQDTITPNQDVNVSPNTEPKIAKPNHEFGHYDDGATPVIASALETYDYPTLPESLMKEFYEALLVLPSDDVYAEYLNWDDIDKDGDIRESKVREIIAIAKAIERRS